MECRRFHAPNEDEKLGFQLFGLQSSATIYDEIPPVGLFRGIKVGGANLCKTAVMNSA